MNKDYVLLNLCEAIEEIDLLIRKLQSEPECGEPEFQVAMMHAYHHMNIAWNARNSTREQTFERTTAEFERWGLFPEDLQLKG
jgi:hypothetical protein